MKTNKPILFVTLGLPGSGKTTFSRTFAKEFHFLHLNSDRIRKALFSKPQYNQHEHNLVFPVMDALVEEALSSGLSVIYDANSTLRKDRQKLVACAKKYGARYILLWMQTPVAIAKQYIQKRNVCTTKVCKHYHPPVPLAVLERLRLSIEEPAKKEPTMILDGRATYAKQKKEVTKVLHT